MQRHEREVLGCDAPELMDWADTVYASAYADRASQDTNDGVRTGVSCVNGWGTSPVNFMESRHG